MSSGVTEIAVDNFHVDNHDWYLDDIINMKSGYIITLKNEEEDYVRNVFTFTGQVVDGTSFSMIIYYKNNMSSDISYFRSKNYIILRGQWEKDLDKVYSMKKYIDNEYDWHVTRIFASNELEILNTITDSDEVVYSVLWYRKNSIGHIRESVINTDCTLSKYAITEYSRDGILILYETRDLPKYVIMDKLTFQNNDCTLFVKAGSVVLTEGKYFRDDDSADFLCVNGYNVTFTITELSYHLLQIEENLNVVEFYPMIVNVTENANTLNVRGAIALEGNPFDIILETNGINRYLERINGESLRSVYGNWKHEEPSTIPNANAIVSYTLGEKKIYVYKSEGEIKIDFYNEGEAVPHYECTATKDLVVTMVRDDFVVSKNLTFRRVEYKPHVYVEKPFTYVFRNLTVTNPYTLDVLDSTIVVNGSFIVEEGATVKCKNLIIN